MSDLLPGFRYRKRLEEERRIARKRAKSREKKENSSESFEQNESNED